VDRQKDSEVMRGRKWGKKRPGPMTLSEMGEDGKRSRKEDLVTEKPVKFPIRTNTWKKFEPSEDQKLCETSARYLDDFFNNSGYKVTGDSRLEKLDRISQYGQRKRTRDLMEEIPTLSTELFPSELLRGFFLKKGNDLEGNSKFLSAEFLSMTRNAAANTISSCRHY